MNKIIFFLCFFFVFTLFSNDLERRYENFSTSIIVPCASDHICFLEDMIMSYQGQSVLPNEMIISVSGYSNKDYEIIKRIEKRDYNFPIFIFKHKEQKYVGDNRNIALSHSSGNICIMQDADDLAHPRRVEIIKFLFDNYKIDHLFHLWMSKKEWEKDKIKDIDIDQIPIKRVTSLKSINDNPMIKNSNGAVSFLRYVFHKVKYNVKKYPGTDIEFNNLVYQNFPNCACVYIPLYIYQYNNSYYRKHNIYNIN